MKIGIEIHQRLLTHKLFCSCSTELNENAQPILELHRQLRPVISEIGEIDEASKKEFEHRKQFTYLAYEGNTCLVELDEEPPHPLNKEALAIALEVTMHLNAGVVDELHMMRKIVIDGSNTCGFQRTGVIGFNGYVDTSKGPVEITTIAIEEESAGQVSANGDSITYRLDRLGIPLIEIATEPTIKDGAHLVETAEKIGMILRATGKVARGLGTIRQDVNVSIEGGARAEIKGAQDLKLLPLLVEQEVLRQKNLIKIIDELKAKFNGAVLIGRSFFDVTALFEHTNAKLIKNGIAAGQKVFGLRLQHHAGFLGKEVQAGRRYGTELSDYAKTSGVKGIIHSDELMEKYSISVQEVSAVRKTLNIHDQLSNGDAFVLVVASEEMARKALENVCKRAEMDFVPKETRRANPDGSTSYMRPLPGRARMYPETDIPAVPITKEMLKEIEKSKGESLEDKKEKLAKVLNKEMADKMLRSKNLHLFERIVNELTVEPMLVANTLENTLISLRREGIELENAEAVLFELFAFYKKGRFVKAAIPEVLKLVVKGKSIEAAITDGKLERMTEEEVERIAKEYNYDTQKIMQKYRLNIDPAELQKIRK